MYEIKEESLEGKKKRRDVGGGDPLVIIRFTSMEPVTLLGQELNITESPSSSFRNCWLKSGARTSESSEAADSSWLLGLCQLDRERWKKNPRKRNPSKHNRNEK